MGQCKSHSYIVKEDAAASVSPRPVPEKVEKKKKGKFLRWVLSRKSKKTSTEAQQSQCRNDSSQQPERCSDGEAEHNSDTEHNSVYSWHSCVSSPASVPDGDKDTTRHEQSGISTHNSNPSLPVPSMTEENINSASTSDDISWKNEDEIIHISSKGKTGEVFQHYETMKMLGRGSYGCVYDGIRLSDSRKVALKYALKTEAMENVRIGLFSKSPPKEVAMMALMNKNPSVPQIIKLLDWYETPEEYVLVLERPTPCVDMRIFLWQNGGKLKELMARAVMRQVVTAARICSERGVHHSDIKLENLLINPNTLQVKLIDFGCSKRLKKSSYSKFCESRDLISSCMERDPAKRINMEKIILHDWFQVSILT
ncbi:unnamed protein product [Leuciscus chuanchicus]